ncbi:FAD-dependent oxidoreductase [Lactiplantibacillus paraplantarum]|uniref:NADH oxidase n=1 Tax=Lactiplantibacillus paraplantarum TaxID=60520 RepID=A0AAD0X823_9LACO|nr:FAD-dependent oxidoreductase [Lactiplantibacillus paraplantarum]AVW11564.1 NADH oxidase [Lactiplantibacillus paraplantarum]AYJ39983.1 NADH oxidase [Lactiplantibacillus paraplantarum]ERL43414.1 NADH oxidase [Lactiplantibacillus paraplantarum]KRL46216.1 NADH oxidase [Lactiplantibacillus paraplantarum DSM 10667]MCU4685051.1 FAD-dependent oxidoreductase [Lactiplantibacillus paraplantarum]
MKVIVIGCTHAGTAAVNQILASNPDTEVTIYERNDNVSFLSCGIALYLGGQVADPQGLFYSSPEQLAELGATVHMQHDVTDVDTENHEITVTDLKTGASKTDHYDKLVVTTGSWPVIPPIDGIDSPNVYLCKNWTHAQNLWEAAKPAKRVIVIGGGYIGTELVEAYQKQGKEVTLIDGLPRILNKYLDKEFTDRVEQNFVDHGIKMALNQMVQGFSDDGKEVTVKTDKGSYTADMAILCVGFRPNTGLLKGKVDMNANGSIKTNDYMQTSDPDIYGAGDSVAVHYNPTQKDAYIPLATNAVRQGTLVGLNIFKPTRKYMGTQSTSGLMLFGQTIVSSGMTLEHAQAEKVPAAAVTFEDNYRPEFMPTTKPVLMQLVYNPETREILGAQFMSEHDVSQSANVISVMIQNHNTIDDLGFVDMFFQPIYDRPFNYLNLLGQAAIAHAAEAVTE